MVELKVPVTVLAGWSAGAVAEALGRIGPPGDLAVVAAEACPGLRTVFAPARVAERSHGCPCCVVRLDVRSGVRKLLDRREPPAQIVVVAGGEADPGPLLATLLCDLRLVRRTELAAVVVVVDGPEAAVRLATGRPVAPDRSAAEHLSVADAVVVLGGDRLTTPGTARVEAALRELNPYSPVWTPGTGAWPVPLAPGGAYDLASVARRLDAVAPATAPPSMAFVEAAGEGDPRHLRAWARDLLDAHAGRLLRVQAVSSLRGRSERWAFSAVRTFSTSGVCGPAPSGAARARVLAVGEGVDPSALARSLGDVLSAS